MLSEGMRFVRVLRSWMFNLWLSSGKYPLTSLAVSSGPASCIQRSELFLHAPASDELPWEAKTPVGQVGLKAQPRCWNLHDY
jgi:hypothetical protein